LFHPNPEKYVTGAFIKIGFFRTDADLIYQDEVHGTLFEQVEQTMQLLLTKYLKAFISYKGLHRIEKYQIPEPALREAVLNAVVHKDYSGGAPIQISVYEDKLMIWNDGQLPDDWTVARLRTKHPSKPYNPAIANCFFRAGLIESWGRGTIRMMDECRSENIPIPSFSIDATEFFVTFKFSNLSQPTSTSNTKLTGTTADRILQLIEINNTITMVELATSTKVSLSTVERTIKRLQELNKIKRMGSDKLGNWVIQK
jgi:ATP-dependent DNA helicase RecG